ncbi:unnamed protein product [Paramecium octaurelia]|uniref:Uncharacterized protein n=1 Tax=Paramecium octaurelia TaxID=43137 RepID=A0A8S1XWY0_PAROT|nr:unnamed protein product [Paramecium octaurelia]
MTQIRIIQTLKFNRFRNAINMKYNVMYINDITYQCNQINLIIKY